MTNVSIATALNHAQQRLNGTESPKLDARVLLSFVLGQSRTYLMTWPERELTQNQWQSYDALIERRALGEPVAYLVGEREFWSLPFKVSEHTLIPRPDTEVLVEQALMYLKSGDSVLDLGTGTGAIAIAIAHERPDINVTGVDLLEEAVELAKSNGERNQVRVHWLQSSWFDNLGEQQYSLIVSNPPYIDPDDPHLTQGDVRFEPRSALVAEHHGLADIELIVAGATKHLVEQGWLLIEHGYDQLPSVQQIFADAGFTQIETVRDYAGQPRVTKGQWLLGAACLR
ncbi:peptide chain release factor N(5)-glutamine methyltransferase [Celerinatantimonas sp. MCCC 1A17872]|uniref:peptide chain release factor N(5)-glutamine methyltransferase n=1 Tax=Celerinatantimonas sp. MCCC 1A17872 TaxID=3177514 RepID=UPI0038CB3122